MRDQIDMCVKYSTAASEFRIQNGYAIMFELSELNACEGCIPMFYCLKSCQRRRLEDKIWAFV
jgi:hypothetical protein